MQAGRVRHDGRPAERQADRPRQVGRQGNAARQARQEAQGKEASNTR
jgi:hypothetical protein